jgi:hypothetical protein
MRDPASGVKGEGEEGTNPSRRKGPRGGKNVVQRREVMVAGQVYDLGELPGDTGNLAPGFDHALSWAVSQYEFVATANGNSSKTVDWVKLSTKLLVDEMGDIPVLSLSAQVMHGFTSKLRERPRWLP